MPMKPILLVAFLILLVSCPNRQETYPTEVEQAIHLFYLENHNDEVLQLTSNANTNSDISFENKTILNLLRAASFCENGMTDSARQIITSIDTQKISKDEQLLFWYNSIKGLWLFRTNQYPEAFTILSSVIDNGYDERAKALSLRLLARIHYAMGDANKASEWLAQSTEMFTKLGLDKSVAINHKMIGRYFASKKNLNEAEKHFKVAEKGLLQSGDSIEIFYIYINLLDVKLQLSQIEAAKVYALKCADYLTKDNDYQAIAILNNNRGEIEYLLHNYETSRNYYKKTLDLPIGFTSCHLRQGYAHLGISKSYAEENNLKEALQYANKAKTIAEDGNFQQLKLQTLKQLSLLHKESGDYRMADSYTQEIVQQLEQTESANERNIETIYNSTIKLIKLESEAKKIENDRRFYLFLIIGVIIFTFFLLIYTINTLQLHSSRNSALKALVEKNLQIINEERKLNEVLHQQINTKKMSRKTSDEDKDLELFNELTVWIQTERHYTRKDLTTEIVARELGTNRDYLARAMSRQNTRINELINKYRIEEAIKILSNKCDKRSNYTLPSISLEVGFNSVSVFFDAFKKQTGMSPAQFRNTACIDEKTENHLTDS